MYLDYLNEEIFRYILSIYVFNCIRQEYIKNTVEYKYIGFALYSSTEYSSSRIYFSKYSKNTPEYIRNIYIEKNIYFNCILTVFIYIYAVSVSYSCSVTNCLFNARASSQLKRSATSRCHHFTQVLVASVPTFCSSSSWMQPSSQLAPAPRPCCACPFPAPRATAP